MRRTSPYSRRSLMEPEQGFIDWEAEYFRAKELAEYWEARYLDEMDSHAKLLRDIEEMEARLLSHGLATTNPFDGSCIHQPILVDEDYAPVPIGNLSMLFDSDLPVPVESLLSGWEGPPETIGGGSSL
jgi:hypothetical protein